MSTSFLASPVASRSWGPVSGPCERTASTTGVELLGSGLTVRRDEQRHEPRRDAVATRREVLPDAHEPARGQLVLRVPQKPHLVAPAGEGPVFAANAQLRSGEPLTCSQSDGRTTSAFGKSSATPTWSTHAAAWSSVRTIPLVSTTMPIVRPFRALRYDTTVAGPLDTLVAPPYDVISAEARLAYLERSPYNVVHLTLPDSDEGAARALGLARRRRARARRSPRFGGSRRTTPARTASPVPGKVSPRPCR